MDARLAPQLGQGGVELGVPFTDGEPTGSVLGQRLSNS
jgi:hypothetical protein